MALKDLNMNELTAMIKRGENMETIRAKIAESCETPTIEDVGILRTNKGALMVRVSGSRWPIAMYKKDWRILLSKVPQIEEALETLDILEENPDKSEKQLRQIEAQEKSRKLA